MSPLTALRSPRGGRLGVGFALALVALAYGLKLHYSRALAEDLRWILEPTAALVELFTGSNCAFEPTGFVNTELGLIITPACAGVNFLVMALVTFAIVQLSARFSLHERFLWCATALGVAFVVTLFVNALRIVLIARVDSDHRVLGVFLYVTALSFLHLGARETLLAIENGRRTCVA